jgi:formamidopyrimidine-DNA glycosylase
MRIVASAQKLPKELLALAPEPLSDEFTEEYFLKTLARARRSLKTLLLDQTRVLGLGNIYAVEALFLAGIHPLKQAHTLSRPRARKLYQAIRTILQEAIDIGSTLKINLNDGESSYIGSTERFWRVYEREGEPCVSVRNQDSPHRTRRTLNLFLPKVPAQIMPCPICFSLSQPCGRCV